jgi:predicted PurR-regulated permease PerM
MIPAIGAGLVCIAASGLLLAIGKPIGAAFLLAWSLLVVGLVDNLVKPLLIRQYVRINGVIVLFSLLGGLGAFGGIGLLVGPLSIALFLAVLRIYQRGRDDPPGADSSASSSATPGVRPT